MDTATISWDHATSSIRFIDQTLLPAEFKIVVCNSVERLAAAIRRLEIRGAPALGAAGGYGVALAASRATKTDQDAFFHEIRSAAELLRATRPTAVNLGWGIDRVLNAALAGGKPEDACRVSIREADALAREDAVLCRRIGDHGAALLPDSCTVLTHCNAGALACVEWGTALGVIRSAVAAGKDIRVIACETRPLNQGSRLTAWELVRDRIDVRVIPDGSAAHLMRTGYIDAVVVGADRICGDVVFNKIGTYMHAVCARHHGIPFYVAAPYSTFDATSRETDVVIEERGREELAHCGGRLLLPDGAGVINPAFDATPMNLITGIITEKGVIYPVELQDSGMQ
jgi:methylthioribose-1-phosphate isomerase